MGCREKDVRLPGLRTGCEEVRIDLALVKYLDINGLRSIWRVVLRDQGALPWWAAELYDERHSDLARNRHWHTGYVCRLYGYTSPAFFTWDEQSSKRRGEAELS